jgi:NAD+ kinase
MFSHNLTSRPLVVNGNSEIRIVIPAESKMTSRLSCDGRESKTINPGGVIQINKKAEQLRLIHPIDYNYFETLRSKLHWEYNF